MPMQTSRTIIFEEFNSAADDLFTILSTNPKDNELYMKLKELEVHSFDEFLEKFEPQVYEVCQYDGNGEPRISYITDQGQGYAGNKLSLSKHAYYRMLEKLYETKGESGKANIQFKDIEADIKKMLMPENEVEEAEDLRKKLQYTYSLYCNAKNNNENASMYKKQYNDCRREIAQTYKKRTFAMLPLAIGSFKKKLEMMGVSSKPNGQGDNAGLLGEPGALAFDKEGNVKVEALPATSTQPTRPAVSEGSTENAIQISGSNQMVVAGDASVAKQDFQALATDEAARLTRLQTVLGNDYDKYAEGDRNEFIKNLVVSTFSTSGSATNLPAMSMEERALEIRSCQEKISQMEDVYRDGIQSFINQLTNMAEKIMGVKAFFDHATADGGRQGALPKDQGVLIANCTITKLLKKKDTFAKYIEKLGALSNKERYWFSVVPNVDGVQLANVTANDSYDDDGDEEDDDLFADMKSADEASEHPNDYVSVADLKVFLKIMDNVKIMTVFGIRGEDGNTFENLDADKINKYINEFASAGYAHAVYAYPNFTLMQEDEKVELSKDDKSVTVKLPEFLIDAAYVAGGLLVGSQQQRYLEQHGFKGKLERDNACVRVDFENFEVRKNLHTMMNRESVYAWSNDLSSEIGESKFGFVFCCDDIVENGVSWKNAYVLFARTLALKGDNMYKPIYQTLTENYLVQQLYLSKKNKRSDVRKALKDFNTQCKAKYSMEASKNHVNLILQEGEEVCLTDDDKIKFNFGNDEATIDDFVIERQ